MQHPKNTELADPFALSSVPLAQRRWSAAIAENHASGPHLAEPTESLKEKDFYIIEEVVATHPLAPHLGSMQPLKVSKNETWYLGWLNNVRLFFIAFSSLCDLSNKPGWTFIRHRSQSRHSKDRQSVVER